MPLLSKNIKPDDAGPSGNVIRRVLVVDDSRAQRRLLVATLTKLGFDVIEAESGEAALAIARSTEIELVISDWMMPGMDGLTLCQKFRALPRETYGYFILLTSKNEKGAVAQGLDIGADDFLTKPINSEELRARIAAGERILRMERELNEKNRLVVATLEEISLLYDALNRDLIEARKMQQSLVRDRLRTFGTAEVALLLKPSGHVGGDLVGAFELPDNRIGIFAIDVSGHGIASALLSARIAGYLSDAAPAQNVALIQQPEGGFRVRPTAEVADMLNKIMLSDMKSDLYFTMTLAYVCLSTGETEITQCGHPNPVVLHADESVSFHGNGGLPIGLVTDASYESFSLVLEPQDRLILYSDGFTECPDRSGQELEETGFAAIVAKSAALPAQEMIEAMVWDLDSFAGGDGLMDDLSCAVVTYREPDART
ncbi:PP2C family protein-serine/threonine phosphatase [Maritimibacter dapengensis]|uniref:PP2C family protein-serine/threonine phosphatase n=1 Tax=Maritimibacter dapengensis TaxID=2836868 RepID=UPI00300CE86A